MWQPDTIQIPLALVEAELANTVPAGTVLAFATYRIKRTSSTPTNLSVEAINVARNFHETGQLVTSDGEMLEITPEAVNHAENIPNQVTEEPVSKITNAEIRKLFKTAFPEFVTPTTDQAAELYRLAHGRKDVLEAAITQMVNHPRPVNEPVGLAVWIIGKHEPDWVIEQAALTQKKAQKNPNQVVSRVLRTAEQQLASLSKPVATQQTVNDLDTLLGELDG